MTLVELLLAVSLAGGLMLMTGHIVLQMTRSVTSLEQRSQVHTEASLALLRMRSELRQATQIMTLSTTRIAFAHPDVTGDGQPDSITYDWNGTPGAPLTRRVGTGSAEPVLEDCRALLISTPPPVEPDEELLASHYMYPPGVVATAQEFSLSQSNRAAQYFSVPGRSGASSFKVTRVRVLVRSAGVQGSLRVGMYNTLLNNPSSAVEWTSKSTGQIAPTMSWEDFFFNSASGLALNTGYAVVVRCNPGTAMITYDHITSGAPATSPDFYRYTMDSGTTWLPIINIYARDLRYFVYGRYLDAAGEPLPVMSAPVRLVDLHVQAGSGSSAVRLDTTIQCVNNPEM